MQQKQGRLRAISAILTAARRAAKALPGFPGELLDNFNDAYEVQRISREAWPDKAVGWKVGGVPAAFIQHFGETRLTGPIFASSVVYAAEGEVAQMPIFRDGFGAIEPEFIIKLGATRAQDRMYIGAEIASSSIPAINNVGPIAVICDFGNNNGMIIGPEIHDWQLTKPDPIAVETHIDGEIVATKVLDDLRDNPRESIKFLLNHAKAKGIEMPTGTFIATGAITGVHEAPIGAVSRLDFGRFGALDLTLVEAGAFV